MADPYLDPTASANAGLTDNVAGGLAYITIIPAIIFLVIEPYKSRPFVRFNAIQCLCLAVTGFVCNLFYLFGRVGFLIGGLLAFVVGICWLIAMIMAFMGKTFVVPGIGGVAQNFAKGSTSL